MSNDCWVTYRGLVPFDDALVWQNELYARRLNDEIPDILLLLEHPHTYTLGRRTKEAHLLFDSRWIAEKGIEVKEADRGGSVSYHGPGQLVGYPIIDLRPAPDISLYLRKIEEVIVLTCQSLGVRCGKAPGTTGVWTNGNKIASIGIKATRGVTKHGFGLNVNTDLDFFKSIVPCGIEGLRMTSLSAELGREIGVTRVLDILTDNFGSEFDRDMHRKDSIAGLF